MVRLVDFHPSYYSSRGVFLKYSAQFVGRRHFFSFAFCLVLAAILDERVAELSDLSINSFPRDLNVSFFDDHIMLL
jgi:hypothetical protein